ncbi:hypothetical protein BDW74DRAFT_176005 [Aspergillus multicolor]|uniref:uncharacterized protein n=1 Tax=Aspergillus multicolor TaxID=41759 RepID=UPI003CCCF876
MQIISLASAGLTLSAVLGAVASPANPQGNSVDVRAVELNSAPIAAFAARAAEADVLEHDEDEGGLDARAENAALIKYKGKCSRDKNECRFTINKKTNFVKCSSKFANKRCTRNGADCFFDSYDRSVECK